MRFSLNGKLVSVNAPPMKRLLDVLREDCRLTGTKEGCGEGECGACTVLIDGQAVNACLVPFAHVRGARVTTIEGLKGRTALQQSFVTQGGAQCGICTPGFIVAASTLGSLRWRSASALGSQEDEIRAALAGNLCRCTGYSAIYRAVAHSTGSTQEPKKIGRGRKARKAKTPVASGFPGPRAGAGSRTSRRRRR